ncbi:ATPases with chaperone activity, ATP-binding subunit [Cupriavidus sp. HMR-1]|uniref:hypothetical protein n=1 Tax=Cupriavidus sp. HMR-1 TaxID=1249621 RepID=UPI0002A3DD4C|nr:hypothetical protein [Cupriavidus sp. HMR-1]EKZ97872.1 ATPases with chaperone activity, ATP-binding subunit [Cupriavidus sp. HMR-1]
MAETATPSNDSRFVITINLDRSEGSSNVAAEELIQRVCFDKLKAQIEHDIRSLRDVPSRTESPVSGGGLVYFLDGTRGAGKSTFLWSIYSNLPTKFDRKAGVVAALDYIDPSRVESNEIVLLTVLHALNQKVRQHRQVGVTIRESRFQDFDLEFRKLAGGLSVIGPQHDQLRDLDPELFLDWGLERAGHSTDLRRALHSVFDAACEILGVDALILAFDDADTHAKHARRVLECIRKYLDTPRLIVLVTGDMELYSLLVRDHFHEDLGDFNRKGHDEERRNQRNRMVDHLEDQYLLKLFPVQRRVLLRPLWNLLEPSLLAKTGSIRYEFTHSEWVGPRDVLCVLEEVIRRGLRIKNPRDIALFQEFLLTQPLRSVLQVLSRCAALLSQSSSETAVSSGWSLDLSGALREGLRATLLGSMYKLGVDIDSIVAGNLAGLTDAVFELAMRDGDYDTATYLRPQASDPDIRGSFAALSSNVAALCAGRPDLTIRYMLTGPGSVSFYREGSGTLKQYKQYMGIGRRDDSLNWAWHATGVVSASFPLNPNFPLIRHGVVCLNMRKPRGVSEEVAGQYRTVQAAIDSWIDAGRAIPAFAMSLVEVSGLNARTFASIYHVLGLIERLLAVPYDSNRSRNVRSELSKMWPPLSISNPISVGESLVDETASNRGKLAAKGISADDESDGDGQFAGPQVQRRAYDPNLDDLCRHVEEWLDRIRGLRSKTTPSSVLIGKIWTRLYFSVARVSDNRTGMSGVASYMELFALCVINAFLVEECDHHLIDESRAESKHPAIGRTNPRTSPQEFIKKLQGVDVDREAVPLTTIIATCPLVLGLLNSNYSDYQEAIRKLEPGLDVLSLLCPDWAWTAINQTYIAGWKSFTSGSPRQEGADAGGEATIAPTATPVVQTRVRLRRSKKQVQE